MKKMKNLIRNKRGSELLEKVIMVAFAIFMGGATIVYGTGIIKQSKKVEIISGFATSNIKRNEVDGSNLKMKTIKFIKDVTGLGLKEAKKALDNEGVFKYYFTENSFFYCSTNQETQENCETSVSYDGGFDALYTNASWEEVKELFDISIGNNSGNILEYEGKEYDYSWELKGQIVDKNSVQDEENYSFTLFSSGSGKIAVIKAIRAATGMGLKQAKDLLDATNNSPQVILESASGSVIKTMYQTIDSGSPDAIYEIKTA